MVLQPQNWANADADISALGAKASEMGREIATQQIEKIECTSIECVGGKAVLLASGIKNNPSQASTMQDSLSLDLAPVPRPRLARAG